MKSKKDRKYISGSNTIKVSPLGAGQHVGRSCILVTLGRKNIMLDCGMHMGFRDERMFPDISFISKPLVYSLPHGKSNVYTEYIDLVLLSHFHLDHSGALPFFTEVCGYNGPIYMTPPTKAITPLLLHDFIKITPTAPYTKEDIERCMKKVSTITLEETIVVDGTIEITPYYAGHVLGACMFFVRDLETGHNFLYTGDFNMIADRHLGSANVSGLCRTLPSIELLIMETTYGNTYRESKLMRERQLLQAVHTTLKQGGKVLIPVFALGRVQELCLLIEQYWERMNLNYPIYISSGMIAKANAVYRLFLPWTNDKIRNTQSDEGRNLFDFKYIKSFERSLMSSKQPMILFATPGMLHAGTSLEVFKNWGRDPKNLTCIIGYCVRGTIGHQILNSENGFIRLNDGKMFRFHCKVRNISFSAHADQRGLIRLVKQSKPKNIVLVHGEKDKMIQCRKQMMIQFRNSEVFMPANGETSRIKVGEPPLFVDISTKLLRSSSSSSSSINENNNNNNQTTIEAILVLKKKEKDQELLHQSQIFPNNNKEKLQFQELEDELEDELEEEEDDDDDDSFSTINNQSNSNRMMIMKRRIRPLLLHPSELSSSGKKNNILLGGGGPHKLRYSTSRRFDDENEWIKCIQSIITSIKNIKQAVNQNGIPLDCYSINSILLKRLFQPKEVITMSWNNEDEKIAVKIIKILDKFSSSSKKIKNK